MVATGSRGLRKRRPYSVVVGSWGADVWTT